MTLLDRLRDGLRAGIGWTGGNRWGDIVRQAESVHATSQQIAALGAEMAARDAQITATSLTISAAAVKVSELHEAFRHEVAEVALALAQRDDPLSTTLDESLGRDGLAFAELAEEIRLATTPTAA